ncbi:restriction endonuclease [Nocardia colli]|uniref:Restriction endonuclease n=1 Tax=Nocardia colli TaxID=2545717 RepID=A0A5N0E6M7_9NOCA|nr:NgoMIV family type II restriction endonuclease [Nocardia colli]KAA8885087.1 restriction endonuclease [Nocardia colli]
MSASFRTELLGWKPSKKNKLNWRWVPNSADVDNATSLRLAAHVLEQLGHPNPNLVEATPDVPPANPGSLLEVQVLTNLANELPVLDPRRRWDFARGQSIVGYAQYQHLADLDKAIAQDPNLRVTLGTDYLIKPDVLIGLLGTQASMTYPWLHAAIACKWTIRSDRVQNIRHENSNMIRHRRGRLPHLVTVTAEPLPTRLASIARGTGEVDATYHITYDELADAVSAHGSSEQKAAWEEVTKQGRLLDYRRLANSLVAG